MAAPSLIAAALGEPAPSHVQLASRTMYVARREDVGADQIICGLAASSDADAPSLLPPADPAAGLVLAVADGTPRNPLSRQRRRRLAAPLRLVRQTVGTKLGLVFVALVAVIVAGFALLLGPAGFGHADRAVPDLARLGWRGGHGPKRAVGGESRAVPADICRPGIPATDNSGHCRVAHSWRSRGREAAPWRPRDSRGPRQLSVHGSSASYTISASRSSASIRALRRRDAARAAPRHPRRHRRDAPGGDAAGGGHRHVPGARVGHQQRYREPGDRAQRQGTRGRAAHRRPALRRRPGRARSGHDRQHGLASTSYLAAPAFAAAVLDHQVLRTIAVGRHVLLLAESLPTMDGLAAGRSRPCISRACCVSSRCAGPDSAGVDWSPAPDYVIRARDSVVVLATRAGLSGMLRRDARQPAAERGLPLPLPAYNSQLPKMGLPKLRHWSYAQGRSFTWFW